MNFAIATLFFFRVVSFFISVDGVLNFILFRQVVHSGTAKFHFTHGFQDEYEDAYVVPLLPPHGYTRTF